MTKGQRLKAFWNRIDIFVVFAFVPLLSAAAGAGVMNWINQRERMQLVDRFPAVRAEERSACVREYQGRLDDLTHMNLQSAQALSDIRTEMEDTHSVVAYMLRFLGDRAKVADARNGALLRQAREAADAAAAARQTTAQVEQKISVAASKADEAANTARAVDRKLDTAVRPPLPARPWAGENR